MQKIEERFAEHLGDSDFGRGPDQAAGKEGGKKDGVNAPDDSPAERFQDAADRAVVQNRIGNHPSIGWWYGKGCWRWFHGNDW